MIQGVGFGETKVNHPHVCFSVFASPNFPTGQLDLVAEVKMENFQEHDARAPKRSMQKHLADPGGIPLKSWIWIFFLGVLGCSRWVNSSYAFLGRFHYLLLQCLGRTQGVLYWWNLTIWFCLRWKFGWVVAHFPGNDKFPENGGFPLKNQKCQTLALFTSSQGWVVHVIKWCGYANSYACYGSLPYCWWKNPANHPGCIKPNKYRDKVLTSPGWPDFWIINSMV